MLDSTLNAVYSSFRAVLGMADQFSRLRSHLGKVFSALAIFRTAKWAYMKLLYMLGEFYCKDSLLIIINAAMNSQVFHEQTHMIWHGLRP